ncbi:MAG: hypothetical protein HUJ54_13400 [Erysipelotrichaceae bacterium]|nr:hypothetical protein [Erysipelotrichaceae bacterium]
MLTKQELILMDLLWNADVPLSLHEILEIKPELNRNTLQSVMRRLMQANMIRVAGYGFNKTSMTRKVTYVIPQYDYYKKDFVPDTKMKVTLNFLETCSDADFLKRCRSIIDERLE